MYFELVAHLLLGPRDDVGEPLERLLRATHPDEVDFLKIELEAVRDR